MFKTICVRIFCRQWNGGRGKQRKRMSRETKTLRMIIHQTFLIAGCLWVWYWPNPQIEAEDLLSGPYFRWMRQTYKTAERCEGLVARCGPMTECSVHIYLMWCQISRVSGAKFRRRWGWVVLDSFRLVPNLTSGLTLSVTAKDRSAWRGEPWTSLRPSRATEIPLINGDTILVFFNEKFLRHNHNRRTQWFPEWQMEQTILTPS